MDPTPSRTNQAAGLLELATHASIPLTVADDRNDAADEGLVHHPIDLHRPPRQLLELLADRLSLLGLKFPRGAK
jgi:hypothetical protein